MVFIFMEINFGRENINGGKKDLGISTWCYEKVGKGCFILENLDKNF